jgi:hypothetical protein
MALDRTWFNTLVDDDGSGMTGSVWDKADVDALMDAVDAEVARLDDANYWLGKRSSYTPEVRTDGGALYGISQVYCQYSAVGEHIPFSLHFSLDAGLASPYITVSTPPGWPTVATSINVASLIREGSAAYETGVLGFLNGSTMFIYRAAFAPFAAGQTYLVTAQGFYYWR